MACTMGDIRGRLKSISVKCDILSSVDEKLLDISVLFHSNPTVLNAIDPMSHCIYWPHQRMWWYIEASKHSFICVQSVSR